MQMKTLKILSHIAIGVVLGAFIYKCGEVMEKHSIEVEEAEESILPDEDNSDETWITSMEVEENSQAVQDWETSKSACNYYAVCRWDDYALEYITKELLKDRNGMKIMQVVMPEDREREKRINRMLVEEGMKKLPSGKEEDWWHMTKIHLDYRSDRYLCWHYIPRSLLSEDCEWEDMYFTLDLEEEKLVEYPGKVLDGGDWGEIYKEMEESWEKTVEEQDATQVEKGYTLHGIRGECDGTSFPAVEVTGLVDETVQKRINEHLQEGLRACIENEGWEDNKERRQRLMNQTKIFISYKSTRWLSIVYSIPMDRPWKWDDEICDLPVAVDMQTGERVLMDDLVEFDGLQDWMTCEFSEAVREDEIKRFNGLLKTERENLKDMRRYTGELAMQNYQNVWSAFYLYRGKLILLTEGSFSDFEIPLPELYEYLKVDPWYD